MDLIKSQAFEKEREGNKLENCFSCNCPNSLVSKILIIIHFYTCPSICPHHPHIIIQREKMDLFSL